jgi:phage tail-like protein
VPPFTVNPTRFDPYKQFKFRVKWDGRYVAGVCEVTPLRRVTEVVAHRDGGEPSSARRSPGRTAFDPLVLRRGRTHDTDFERWANKVWRLGSGPGAESSLKDFRKDVMIELHNEAGQLVMAFKVYRCWPSEYVALGALDSDGASTAIESITLQHEGFERDDSIPEPAEPSLDDSA